MLINPFTPSEIVSEPQDFFGRTEELRALEQAIPQGSVAILGAIGIGKSSLLARFRLHMEGFSSEHQCKSVIAVGDKDVVTVDNAARLVLESFTAVDETQHRIKFKLGEVFEIESAELYRNFAEGHHLAALKRIVEAEYLDAVLSDKELLLLAVDEADKCPVALARLVRAIVTHTQHQGVKRVRFILAGVSPFFQHMVDEDSGINRFVYRTLMLEPMSVDEATYLVETKLVIVAQQAEASGLSIIIDPRVISRVVALSGGHPHILQLLGSHLIEHENEDPDGKIDSRDLVNSLRRICYEDRARVYDSTLHLLELNNKLDVLQNILEIAEPSFPTRIGRDLALNYGSKDRYVSKTAIQWLVKHNILSMPSPDYYGLVDEFLRIRLLLDGTASSAEQMGLEERIIQAGGLTRHWIEDE